jgi:hypothetical protein
MEPFARTNRRSKPMRVPVEDERTGLDLFERGQAHIATS